MLTCCIYIRKQPGQNIISGMHLGKGGDTLSHWPECSSSLSSPRKAARSKDLSGNKLPLLCSHHVQRGWCTILAWLGGQGTATQLQPYLCYHGSYFQKGILHYYFYKHRELNLEWRQTQLGDGGCQILLSNRLRNRHTCIIHARQFVWQIIVSAVT